MEQMLLVFAVIAAMIGFVVFIVYLMKRASSEDSDPEETPAAVRKPEKKPEKRSGGQTYDSIFVHKTTEKKVICPYCGGENWPQAKYCDVCGEPM